MKKYYVVKMVSKKQANEEELFVCGRYIVTDEKQLKEITYKPANEYGIISKDFEIHFEETDYQMSGEKIPFAVRRKKLSIYQSEVE